MTLSAGDRIPDATLFVPGEGGPEAKPAADIFAGRKVVLIGMPGAFTPTCHRNHLPGFLENRDAMLEKGVDEIVVLTCNDAFVLKAWAEANAATGRVLFVSDGNAEFVRKAGISFDGAGRGMGHRSQRFAAIVEDGVVTWIAVEDQPGKAVASSAAEVLQRL